MCFNVALLLKDKDCDRVFVGNDPVNLVDPWGLRPSSNIPSGVSVQSNIKEARNMSSRDFYNAVKSGGKWDYKQQGSQYENFGNYNYGATGRAAGLVKVFLGVLPVPISNILEHRNLDGVIHLDHLHMEMTQMINPGLVKERRIMILAIMILKIKNVIDYGWKNTRLYWKLFAISICFDRDELRDYWL